MATIKQLYKILKKGDKPGYVYISGDGIEETIKMGAGMVRGLAIIPEEGVHIYDIEKLRKKERINFIDTKYIEWLDHYKKLGLVELVDSVYRRTPTADKADYELELFPDNQDTSFY